MEISLTAELEAALKESAACRGLSPSDLEPQTLNERFLHRSKSDVPRDPWERSVLALAKDCGVSLPHGVLSSNGLHR